MSAAPFSILAFQSAEAGVPAGATKMLADAAGAAMWPTEASMLGQAPGWLPRTVKVPAWHRGTRARSRKPSGSSAARLKPCPTNLFCERIPDARAEVEEVGPPGVAFISQIDAANPADGDGERGRGVGRMKTEARAGFDKIGPILLLYIEG